MSELDLGILFGTCRTAFRLATLDTYVVPEERHALSTFLQTGELGERVDGWDRILSAGRDRGAVFERVQILSTPLTDYARFLLAVYAENQRLGEHVRVAYRSSPIPIPGAYEDFWLFDGRTVAVMDYTAQGVFLGFHDGSDELDHYLNLRLAAMAASAELGSSAVA